MIGMKLNSGFIAHNDGADKLLVPTGAAAFSGLVRSNSTAGFIIECLEQDTTEEAIVAKMLARYDVPEAVARQDIRRVLTQLQEIGAIDE